jgi:glycosyltransferase involved in cell wall biosynthesis
MMTDQTMVPPPELTILMPCLNEAETLGSCIRKAREFLDRHQVAGEIVIGDNGSTDGSQKIAADLGARVVPVAERGYGAAIYHASLAARGRYIIMGDSDDSYDFSKLLPFLERLRAGDDLVMGNRFLGGIRPGAMPFKNRYFGNPVLSGIGRLFFRAPVRDFHCGLRGYSREAFLRMDLRTPGMEFASEMVIKAMFQEMRIVEVPTTLDTAGRCPPPHLRPWRDGWRHLRFMLLCSPRWLFWHPGLFLGVLGGAGFLWLWPAPRHFGNATLDIHALLLCAVAIILGIQSMSFAILAKAFQVSTGLGREAAIFRQHLARPFLFEHGLWIGGLLLVLGLAGVASATAAWEHQDFGPLDPSHSMRTVIPSALAMVLGGQIVFSASLLSVFCLNLQRRDPAANQSDEFYQ